MSDTPDKPPERPRKPRRQPASGEVAAAAGDELVSEQAAESMEEGEAERPGAALETPPPRRAEVLEEKPAPKKEKKAPEPKPKPREGTEGPHPASLAHRMRFGRSTPRSRR